MLNDDVEYIARLFSREVPEIADGIVVIKAVARKPRFRTKIAVYSHDPKVDCIAACVGVRGNRIKRIVDDLHGERIDLIRWDESLETLIANSLQPAAIESITLHPARHRATVLVKEDQLPLAIGRQDLNRELTSKLCARDIEIVPKPPGSP
jgi:N utilization substance protein A